MNNIINPPPPTIKMYDEFMAEEGGFMRLFVNFIDGL